MIEVSDPIKASINAIISGLPAIATFLFALNTIKTRKTHTLNTWESSAVLLVFWGFILFAIWENLLIPISVKYSFAFWLQGWLIPLLIGVIFTIVAVVIGKKEKAKK